MTTLFDRAAEFGEASLAHSAKGEVLPAIENLDRGIALLEKALAHANKVGGTDVEKTELRARTYDFVSRKADLLLAAGGTTGALNAALYLCSLDPRNATGFFTAGQALRKVQRYEQAVDYLTAAAKLDPSNPHIRQCLEMSISELRLPSTVGTAAVTATSTAGQHHQRSSNSIASAAAGTTSPFFHRHGDLQQQQEFPSDIDGIIEFAKKYVPSANQIIQAAKEKPAIAVGVVVGILVLLAILITIDVLMFLLCFAVVVALHRWEQQHNSSSNRKNSFGGNFAVTGGGNATYPLLQQQQQAQQEFRIPVLQLPLSVVTSTFLACAAVYFLLL